MEAGKKAMDKPCDGGFAGLLMAIPGSAQCAARWLISVWSLSGPRHMVYAAYNG